MFYQDLKRFLQLKLHVLKWHIRLQKIYTYEAEVSILLCLATQKLAVDCSGVHQMSYAMPRQPSND